MNTYKTFNDVRRRRRADEGLPVDHRLARRRQRLLERLVQRRRVRAADVRDLRDRPADPADRRALPHDPQPLPARHARHLDGRLRGDDVRRAPPGPVRRRRRRSRARSTATSPASAPRCGELDVPGRRSPTRSTGRAPRRRSAGTATTRPTSPTTSATSTCRSAAPTGCRTRHRRGPRLRRRRLVRDRGRRLHGERQLARHAGCPGDPAPVEGLRAGLPHRRQLQARDRPTRSTSSPRTSPTRPPPRTSFDYRSIEPDFDVWGWRVERDPDRALEFMQLSDVSDARPDARRLRHDDRHDSAELPRAEARRRPGATPPSPSRTQPDASTSPSTSARPTPTSSTRRAPATTVTSGKRELRASRRRQGHPHPRDCTGCESVPVPSAGRSSGACV